MSVEPKINTDIKISKFTSLTLRQNYKDADEKDDYGILQWSTRMGYPRINVYISNAKTKNIATGAIDYNNTITAPFDYDTLNILFKNFKHIIDGANGVEVPMDCYNTKYVNGVKTDEVYLQARVILGKSPKGIIYISVEEDKKRKIKFPIMSRNWHGIYDVETGNLVTDKAVLSKLYSESYLERAKDLFKSEMIKDGIVTTARPVKNPTGKYTPPKIEEDTVPPPVIVDKPKIETTESTNYDLDDLI